MTDAREVGKVVLNLSGNAVHCTHAGEVVLCVDGADSAETRMHVRDTGPGVAPRFPQ